jgi:predicted transposase YbfD/YdcC
VEKGHGRNEKRTVRVSDVEAMTVGFPYAKRAIKVESFSETRGKRSDPLTRDFLCSSENLETGEECMKLIRGHWGGIEIRNHWRKDACLFEDKTRSRNPNIVGSLMLLRNATLSLFFDNQENYGSLPAFIETIASDTRLAMRLLFGFSS